MPDPACETCGASPAELVGDLVLCPVHIEERTMKTRKPSPHKTRCRSGCNKRTESPTGLCIDCRPRRIPKRTARACETCGKRTEAQSGQCRPCAMAEPEPVVATEFDRLALDGGTWHYVKGVWRWIHWEAA